MSCNFDLRYVFILVINIMKSAMPLYFSWDPFCVIGNPTWIKFWLLFVLLLLFSFVSIEVSSNPPFFIRVRVKSFSAILIISFLASVVLPQFLFWYFYPVILLSSSSCISIFFKSFVLTLQAILSATPGVDIYITTANADIEANAELFLETINELEGADHEDGPQV